MLVGIWRLFLLPSLKTAIINLDDEFGRALAKEVRDHVCVWGCSLKEDISEYKEYADYFVNALEIKSFDRGFHLSVATPKGSGHFDIPLLVIILTDFVRRLFSTILANSQSKKANS